MSSHIDDPNPEFDAGGVARKEKEGRRKHQSAWIAFFGRIVAQLVGAAATVGLGILLVRSQMGGPATPPALPTPAPTALPSRALGQQRSVEEVFALLDRDRDGRLTEAEVPADMWLRMSRADSDRDGAVTPGELAAARVRAQALGEEAGR
jgi:hypothetical protein